MGPKGSNSTPHPTQDLENLFTLCKDFNLLYLGQHGLASELTDSVPNGLISCFSVRTMTVNNGQLILHSFSIFYYHVAIWLLFL